MKITVGLFDSGLGGLTILKHLQSIYPQVDFIYVADYAYNPYGIKDFKVIEKRVQTITTFLEKECDIIIVACNTASIHIDSIVSKKPLYGVIIPTAEYAIKKSSGHIGVFATNKTIEDGVYQRLILATGLKVTTVKASEFVEIIESNKIDDAKSVEVYKEKLAKLKEVDTIILGCTHFKLIEDWLKKIDPKKLYLTSNTPIENLLNPYIKPSTNLGKTKIYLTKSNQHFNLMVNQLHVLYQSIEIVQLT